MKKQYKSTPSNSTSDSQTPSEERIEMSTPKGSAKLLGERIVERLDLQLLITIIVFFVSGWAFLNNIICGFTDSANHNEVINYMLVHYVLTTILFLCIYITYLKGKYVIDKKAISTNKDKYFELFMDSWFYSLLLCVAIIWFSTSIPWWFCFLALVGLLYYEIYSLDFEKVKRRILLIWLIGCFPLFISTMTLINKNNVIQVDKEYYTIDENILITVNSQGYACSHKLVCLGQEELYQNTKYMLDKNMIVLKAATIKNNVIAVGTVSPASGFPNFFVYPLKKMFQREYEYIDIEKSGNKKFVNYQSKSINIRP